LLLQIWNWPIKAIFTHLKSLSVFKTFCQEHLLYFLSYHLGKKYSVSPIEHNKYRLTQNKAWQINKQKAPRRAFNLSQLLWINIYLVFICFLLHLAVSILACCAYRWIRIAFRYWINWNQTKLKLASLFGRRQNLFVFARFFLAFAFCLFFEFVKAAS